MRGEKIRYVTRRRNKSGAVRWYWQRPGHRTVRLPDNPVERDTQALHLNAQADARQSDPLPRGSIGWVAKKYRDSDDYAALAPGTTKYYKRFLREIESIGPRLPFTALTRQAVIDFIETFPGKAARVQCAAVLRNLFLVAMYYGVVEQDHTRNLRLKRGAPRDVVWTPEDCERWLATAHDHDAGMVTPFLLLQYTAQRPSDVLLMTRTHYRDGVIRVRQAKTKKLVDVPCHSALAAHLDALPTDQLLFCPSRAGRKMSYTEFHDRWTAVSRAAGVTGPQPRDHRRTAMVNMAEAGATDIQIAGVSGHSIEDTKRILEHYIPRNLAMARAAVVQWEGYRK